MATIDRSRVWPVLLLLTAILLVHPPGARAERIDINDPTVLGPVLVSDEVYDDAPGLDLQRAVAEVRYAGGMYSYIYAVTDSTIFPGTFCCDGSIVSFAVTGHPLEGTWGAIYSSDVFWTDDSQPQEPTKTVASITPLHDGFLVVPEPRDLSNYTVVYAQSPLPPSRDGILTYTGRVLDRDQDPPVVRTESFQSGDVLVPIPEPGTIVLTGLGLATLAAKRRASRHRRVARSR